MVVDSLENLREIAVQRLEIEFAGARAAPSTTSAPSPACAMPRSRARHLVVAFEGSADALVKAVSAHEVLSIRSRDDDLEEIFLHYYRDTA